MHLIYLYSGFSGLVPKFCIRDAGGDENRLPTSSTCVNLLKVSCPVVTLLHRWLTPSPPLFVASYTATAVQK
jgi:hypothetical protein